jgi:hypothetical protein
MRLHLFTFSGFAALLLGLMPACEGGQTGDLSGDRKPTGGTGLDSNGGCDEHKQKLAGFDEMTDQGTAEALLAMAEKSFDAPISWQVAADGQTWSVGPEAGKGSIHLDVTRGASAYLLTYSAPASDSGALLGSICPPPALGVDAHVSVTTDGGALAESYDTMLRSSMAGVATLGVPLDLQKLGGTLAVTDSNAQAKLVQLSLQATLTAQGSTGTVSGMEQVDSGSGPDSASSASQALLAVWPDSEACQAFSRDGDGLGVPLDQPMLGVTGQQSIAALAWLKPVDTTWMDGTKTTITLTIESTGDGCFQVKEGQSFDPEAGPGVSYPVTITLKSADGRVDGQYAGQVDVTGSGTSQRVIASANVELPVAEPQKSGFKSVNVPAGTDSLLLEVESKLIGGSSSGSVSLFALASPPCATTPPMSTPDGSGSSSSPGCVGQSETRLENAYWGN